MEIREVRTEELDGALALIWDVFGQFVAKDLSKQGCACAQTECIAVWSALLPPYGIFGNRGTGGPHGDYLYADGT